MLAVTSYKSAYVAQCRKVVKTQLAAFSKLGQAGEEFGAAFFNPMVLALDHYFLHRQRSNEGKDGSPLNELRMLCDSIKEHAGTMTSNSTIKYDPLKSVTGIRLGEAIALDAETYGRLAEAVFSDIEKKYP
jgi:hypothetical protein